MLKRPQAKAPPLLITYQNHDFCLKDLELSLAGDFQTSNAALALSACLHHARKTGKDISEQSIRTSLKDTSWAGRMEVISSRPTILLDIAHNPAAVKEMVKSAQKLFSYTRVIVIYGAMKDKQSDEMLQKLTNFADHFILVRPNQERSENPTRFKKILKKYNASCEVIESIPKAIRKVKQTALSDDMVCITGSIFTVGEAKQYLDNESDFKNNFSPPTGLHLNG